MNWNLKRISDGTPLYRQFERILREAIGRGELKPGDRIPSVVELAKRWKVNKLTVLKAFQELERGGWIASHVGKGTFVASVASSLPAAAARPETMQTLRKFREINTRGWKEILALERPPGTLNLAAGVPPPDTVAVGTLERLTQKILAKNPERFHEYGGPAGLPELREALSARTGRVSADQIIITNGSQQAFSVLACWALDRRRTVVSETPMFTGIPTAFSLVGHTVETTPWGEAPSGTNRLLCVCPDFHNPTGQTLSEGRRRTLASWAQNQDGFLVVDEAFRDLRFMGHPLPSLYDLAPPGRRVLVGSLSKTFMTGLRVGFLVADPPLIQELLFYKRYMDLSGPSLTQALAACFLEDGYDRHLKQVRKHYLVRREAILKALEKYMPKGISWTRPEGGFHLWVTLPRGFSSVQLFLLALERGVAISPGPVYDIDGRFLNSFRLGFGHLTPDRIPVAMERLADAVKELFRQEPVDEETSLGIPV